MTSTRIRSRRHFVVAKDPASNETASSTFNGREVRTPLGHVTPGGLIMLQDRLTTSKTCHEVELVAVPPGVDDLAPGDRVIVYLGGEADLGVGISAFPALDGTEHSVIPEGFIWAKLKDGEIIPRGRIILTERDDVAFKRYTFGREFAYELHSDTLIHGLTASGDEDPTNDGARTRDAVTALYERVYRTGPKADADLVRGQVVCFSPSYSSTRLTRLVGGVRKHYHLVDGGEVFFSVE